MRPEQLTRSPFTDHKTPGPVTRESNAMTGRMIWIPKQARQSATIPNTILHYDAIRPWWVPSTQSNMLSPQNYTHPPRSSRLKEPTSNPVVRARPPRNLNRRLAGPPGFEPGTLPQDRELSRAFRVASQRFVIPEVKASPTLLRRHRCST